MLLPNRYSFTIVKKKNLNKDKVFSTLESDIVEDKKNNVNVDDSDRRNFLKILGGAGVSAAVLSMIPNKAQALIIGSSPTAGIVGVKNASNIGVNPATEDGNLATIAAKDFATETTLNTLKNKDFATETTLSAIKTNSDKFSFDVNGKLLTSNGNGSDPTSTVLKDVAGNTVNPSSEESILYLRRMVKMMESNAVVDSQMRQRVTIDVIPTVTVTGTITANIGTGTMAAVTTVNQLAGVDSRWQIIDWSRQAYNSGIRNNLINS